MRPMMGAFLLITFLGAWNNFISPADRAAVGGQAAALCHNRPTCGACTRSDYGLMMSGTVVSIAPVMCLFLLLQKRVHLRPHLGRREGLSYPPAIHR
jgi:multiple sugar transport system permease protein